MLTFIIFLLVLLVPICFIAYGSAFIGSGVFLSSQCHFKTQKKQVLLTFDDGVDLINTPKVLALLRKYGITACFFVIGKKAEQNKSLLIDMQKEGHVIGSHTFSHSVKGTFQLSNVIQKDILKGITAISPSIVSPKLFRPPFGVTNPHIAKAVNKLGLKSIGWSIRSFDTRMEKHSVVVKRIHKQLHPGAIILLHDTLPESAILLEKLIIMIIESGYSFAPPSVISNL